ncbi:hypothetical protein UPYG_G00117320 [Umbra pygmaea]|uniref:Type I cytokine receptor cytokine-binding domain-containing protein n=1 Tax=Umbra pygmaea TaxID=75934 RepID=A0ABD0X452_UMBPY
MLRFKTFWQLPVILMLISEWNRCIKSHEITVDSPETIGIDDTGHLGPLYIHWTAPSSLTNLTDCSVRYHLEYYNTYQNRWTVIRTVRTSYNAQFDLEKEVRVRIATLLRGGCVNGTELKSPFAETILPPKVTGPVGSRVLGFGCVFYQKEFMECTWHKSLDDPPHSQRSLYFWHRGMEQAAECPQYIYSNGLKTGCKFCGESLPEFTNFNICVNSSSSNVALMSAFFSLQIQNHVKPAAIEVLHLEAGPDRSIQVEWTLPQERIPEHCLEHEVETRKEGQDKQESLQRIITRELTLTVSMEGAQRRCFRVRSRIHQYCADRGFWSDWSHWSCYPDLPKSNAVVVFALVASLVISIFVLSLCGWALWRWRKGREGKTIPPSHLNKLMEYSKGLQFIHKITQNQ